MFYFLAFLAFGTRPAFVFCALCFVACFCWHFSCHAAAFSHLISVASSRAQVQDFPRAARPPPPNWCSTGEQRETQKQYIQNKAMSIMSMISAARRELTLREAYYPLRVERGQMSPEKAQHEVDAMRAIVQLLEEVGRGQWREVDHG